MHFYIVVMHIASFVLTQCVISNAVSLIIFQWGRTISG